MRYVYFRKNLSELKGPGRDAPAELNKNYELKAFKPDCLHITAKGMKKNRSFIAWWFLYLISWRHKAKSYEYYLVYDGEKLIHYCGVLPKYYRYPFMNDDDVQIGPFWTAEDYRGQGICPIVISRVMEDYKSRNKYAYIITRENNVNSQRSITKAGLDVYGHGFRTRWFWGKFLIETEAQK
jgi:RimJ/RimL family protein N-acetyltransferase